jgi:ATP-dependent DNA helicase RecQ
MTAAGPERKWESGDLHRLLKKHWGYSEFRPRQEAIVQAILAGRDAAVVMPTGGGKSLCYQLPAVAMERTCVVISPLIALMQDQAASMREVGIEAAFLNSSQNFGDLRDVQRKAEKGEFRLLYLSPERAVRDDVLTWLKRVSLGFFAIDEAHCISEWGHEFRPEYRQLRVLRACFPDVPIAAFTASATRQVRHDILAQLQLRDPARIALSFHRPNLRYAVRECSPKQHESLLLAALDWYGEGNVIVYAPTVKGVELISALLEARGIPAVAYHGQMGNALRRTNQELWMSGERRVLVGTIAFGLGINKPDVRAVIHLAMPKSLEQYYQEAGRAGRDGQPADCVLLWQRRDIGLLTHFIQQVQDPAERERSWRRYHVMRKFVEEPGCRHRKICLHFGEIPKWERCNACDACGVALDWMDVQPAAAEPVPRTRRISAVRANIARTLELPPLDEALRAKLREWRRDLARSHAVPAYVILHDSTLEAICRHRPRTIPELLTIPGIGERRAERFGEQIIRLTGAA